MLRMNVVVNRLVSIAVCAAALLPVRAGGRLDSLYARIDKAIASSDAYVARREARIAALRQRMGKARGAEAYGVAMSLYAEYKPYMNDSALAWLDRAAGMARAVGDDADVERCRVLTAFQCSSTGMYTEAADIMAGVDRGALDSAGLIDYYRAYNHMYNDLRYYTKIESLRRRYAARARTYADSLIAAAPATADIRLQLLEVMSYERGDYAAALAYSDRRMARAAAGSHEYAVASFYRYLDLKMMRPDGDEWACWLAQAALADVENAVMDQAALWELANHLYEQGDIERAYRYINFAAECAARFSTRLRNQQIAPVMQTVDSIYQLQNEKENAYLKAALGMMALLIMLALAFLVYVNRNRRHLAQARNELSRKNGQLLSLNERLSRANAGLDEANTKLTATGRRMNDAIVNLDESNRVKEKYIGLFLRQCSTYIDRMDRQRKEISNLLKGKRYAELAEFVSAHNFRDKEQEELFEIFDSTFIRLFPTFVDEFNRLLLPQNRIQLTDNSKLNTGIRIFALIRLGIDDSSKIAEFLHYSVNTIYNYRAKIKNGAACGRDEFEDRVREIGLQKSNRGGKIGPSDDTSQP